MTLNATWQKYKERYKYGKCKATKEAWRAAHPEILKRCQKNWRNKNKKHVAAYLKAWKLANPDRDKEHERRRVASGAKPRYRKAYLAKRLKSDPEFAVLHLLRCRIRSILKKIGVKKFRNTFIVPAGCDKNFLSNYIESKFKSGMTWANRGKEWHLHHIRPCNSFDLTDAIQQQECFHYSNLVPVWIEEHKIIHGKKK